MKPVLAGIRASLLAAVVLLSGGASGKDGGPEAGTTADAGKSCTDSNDCTQPAAHCHPTRHECVECLSSRNCSTGLVCNVAAGVCATCSSDADCPTNAPYCASGACVQCRTDANCGSEGVVCSDGVCGSCGDGVCHRSERLLDSSYPEELRGCPEDCASQCPTLTLELNEVRNVPVTRNTFEFNCSGVRGTNDLTVAFTAPKEFYYELKLRSDDLDAFLSISQLSGCGVTTSGCGFGDFQRNGYLFWAAPGETVTLLIEAAAVREFEVQIVENSPVCNNQPGEPVPEGCEPTEPPVDAGKPAEEQTAECLTHAGDRGDPMCAGVTCACTECPRAHDACGEAEGCDDVVQCMHDKGCIGVDCYTSGACRRLTDSHGGVSGPAFRAATALQACTLSHLCGLPCVDGGGPAGVPDAGALCEPGRKVACSCDAGTGTKRCDDSGSSFSECVCSPRDVPLASSCDCNMGRRTSPGAAVLLLLGLTAGFVGRRGGFRASRRRR